MLSLISIRVKFLIRNPCLLFWSYLFIPIIILIIGIFLIKFSDEGKIRFEAKKDPYTIISKKFSDVDYSYLSNYFYSTTFLFLEDKGCQKLDDFVNKKININRDESSQINIICTESEAKVSNTSDNVIKIKKKNNKYRIDLLPKNKLVKVDNSDIIDNINGYTKIVNILKDFNVTNESRIEEIKEYLMNTPMAKILPYIKESSGDYTKKDVLKIIDMIKKTEFQDIFQLFNKDELEQDKITDAFYNHNETITFDFYNIFLRSPKTKFDIFFELQSFLSHFLIYLKEEETKTTQDEKDFTMTFGINSYPDSYKFTEENDPYLYTLLTGFLITLQFSLSGYSFNLRMIDEKENKLNLLLERQGISKIQYNVSWLITYIALFLLSIVGSILFLLGMTKFHPVLVIINVVLFSICIYCVSIFFTTCIKTIKTGGTAVKFYNFGLLLMGFIISVPKVSKITKVIFCFIPQVNMFAAINILLNLSNFKTLTWDLMLIKSAKISMLEIYIMYIVQIVFYLGLSFIVQSYRDSGLPFTQYVLSFCTKVSRDKSNINEATINDDLAEKEVFEIHHQELSPVNQEYSKQKKCLKLVNVCKNFGDVKAVDNFNGELYPNEIFCLLGHNGAGKSTTINMISGIYDPDHGDIFLDDISLVTNKNYLYRNIGLCQQEDIYFDYLTVEEHLQYMCRIKGSAINQAEIEDLIEKIELAPKKNALCRTLSGGQKRKLCIALALIGNSKIILLDEPTSGMDVMARRSLWEFLKNYKKDKILLLTTHFLDEAEYLGDRIGIMSEGKFLCSGTSSFLKSKYPCGFNINLIINSSIFNEELKNQFFNGIKEFEPKAEIKVASKGVFSLNIQSNNQHIQDIFNYIDERKAQYGIEDYTVSSTSLEDVFLKINNKANLGDVKYAKKDENNDLMFNNVIPTSADFFKQLLAQIIRGLFPLYRNKTLFFLELLSSLGFVYLFVFFFSGFISNFGVTKLSLIEVLEAHKIYYSEKNVNDFLKNSDLYQSYGTYITLKKLDNIEDNDKFFESIFENSLAHIAKGSLFISKENDINYEVLNTEIDTSLNGYLLANTMLFFSGFLKAEYGIDATIFPEISLAVGGAGAENVLNSLKDTFILIIICIISIFGFVIFLGGLMFEKIREKRTNIKHLLYLSGNNIFSYWIGFLIVDYLKLFIYNIFFIIPIMYINGVWKYFGLDMLGINLSSLVFIYFITFLCSKDNDGALILFVFIFGFLIILALAAFLYIRFKKDKSDDQTGEGIMKFLLQKYWPTFLDFTPITSMGLSFIRLMLSFNTYDMIYKQFEDMPSMPKEVINEVLKETNEKIGYPSEYIFTNYIAQLINLIIYGFLLFIAETGILGKMIHNFELLLYARREDNYVFSKEVASEEFAENNNININTTNVAIPLLDNDNPINSINSINTINDNQVKGVSEKSQEDPILLVNSERSTIYDPLQNEYVQKEKEKVESDKELTTRISGLVKTFYSCCGRRNVRAINKLYLGLEPNEKFGLLGFNGSGKTTTFRAITNEILTDAGSVTLFGYNTKLHFERIRTMIGYCPQINPLFDFMKVKEIIKFYSELKTCNESVTSICQRFGLSKYLDTYTINLSGGNKRKLTFAIAMMNRPSLLLLDEPSTGVDPESRRIMWRNINELSNSGHKYNMILTTHSMEEAEVLCDTVSWFKAGNFITKGNPEELKIKYSAGYKLHIKFDDDAIKEGGGSDTSIEVIDGSFERACSLIEGFHKCNNTINLRPQIKSYIKCLVGVIEKIKDKTSRISFNYIGQDLSFELVISIINERKKDLFIEILNMKNKDKGIAEMSIAMQSLENILTSLK